MAHDQDPGYVLAAGAVFLVLCVMFVCLRMYTRYMQKTRLGIDEFWLTIPALVGLLVTFHIVTFFVFSKLVTNDLMTLVDGYWFCLGFNHWFVSESG